MNELKKIRHNCKEATFLIEKKQLTRLTIREKIKLRIHLAGCVICRIFEQQSIMINRTVKELFHTSQQSDVRLDDQFKRTLQDRIEEKMKKD